MNTYLVTYFSLLTNENLYVMIEANTKGQAKNIVQKNYMGEVKSITLIKDKCIWM